jgi:hypothetical protein
MRVVAAGLMAALCDTVRRCRSERRDDDEFRVEVLRD